MAKMIRKQIYIEERQETILKREAEEQGISEAAVLRRCLDDLEERQRRLEAWKDLEASINERMERYKDAPQTGRTWTRDELYEERMERYSR